MKFDLKVRTRFIKSMEGDRKKKIGFAITVNDRTVELRKKHSFEKDLLGNDGSKILRDGEKNHGWIPERGGLYEEAFLNLPKDLCVKASKHKMSYAEAVGMEKSYQGANALDWILDEFDSSFDDLAIASMKYHMDWSVAVCDPESRERYENLIKRFEDYRNAGNHTEAEIEHITECFAEAKKADPTDFLGMRRKCDECKDISERVWERKENADKERQQIRKDFIDVLPGLWS